MDLGLKGKVAIITGGREGIGYAAAWEMANEGANVVICARTLGPLEDAAKKAHLMGRMAEAKEIASVVSWLTSSKSKFITGQIIFVDGGLMRVH